MSSSTSSSSAKSFLPVVGCVLLALCALEAVTRLVLFPASLDFVRFAQYPEQAQNLVRQRGVRLALIGNSATEDAVDVEAVESALETRGEPVEVELFLADGSGITTWRSMIERYFWKPALSPDLLMITYFESRLEDGSEDDLGRLAQFFVTPSDWPELLRIDLRSFSDRMEFLLSTGWATYAARTRIKDRVLALFVPDYKEFKFGLNAAAQRHAHRMAEHATPAPRRYDALKRTLERAREAGTRLCFVAFPMRRTADQAPYPIDPELLRVVRAGGGEFVDLRVMPELDYADYRDPVHLRPSGRAKYSKRLVEILAEQLDAERTR